ncbi:MAG: EAL domain-containing protein [Methyloversatilis sp.]|jgi:EAL domain-containing protein (putative c-di-GMP-specific phosphodiesterase class I)/GGDEF domain-containing protein|nr:EAL domain-containing protein [Methyloversatilis sp.]MBP6194514.1 EAL domain-containing protein [Methyloversatilis sp.]MBP9118366.1 EAL domain-containing protein [Methyloversatilis sp.]
MSEASNQGNQTALRALLDRRALDIVFQPIMRLDDGAITAHEALVRGPEGSALHLPSTLFSTAREIGVEAELELACIEAAVRKFNPATSGSLLVNASAGTIQHLAGEGCVMLLSLLGKHGLSPSRLVLELTEHERVTEVEALRACLCRLSALGIDVALDDFGDGRSSLRLWAELSPARVKLDRYFAHNINIDSRRVEAVRAAIQLARAFGAELVAEGIETEAELAVLRDLGVHFGQGYLIGRPQAETLSHITPEVSALLKSRQIAVLPDTPHRDQSAATVSRLALAAPAVEPATPNIAVAQIFMEQPQLLALPVLENGIPVGLINRRSFMDRYAQPYQKEVYGKRPCSLFMNANPLRVERSTPLDAMSTVLAGEDQRYLYDGFVLTENGRYCGVATGESLVRAVTEIRIEAARHANPLTFLPGNIPITEHLQRLMAGQARYAAAYFDLNNFKPFNDLYGYYRGDEMIKLAARCIQHEADPLRDFVGHVGGDDFIVLFQSEDWQARCDRVIRTFNAEARGLFNEDELASGFMEGEDRKGYITRFPLTTLCAGVVLGRESTFHTAEEVASAAASAKRRAKASGGGLYVEQPSLISDNDDGFMPALEPASGSNRAGPESRTLESA